MEREQINQSVSDLVSFEQKGTDMQAAEYENMCHLWATVADKAVNDFNGNITFCYSHIGQSKENEIKRIREDAVKWFNSNQYYPGSFCWCCELFFFDTEWCREQIALGLNPFHDLLNYRDKD